MKRSLLFIAIVSLTACSTHLPPPQPSAVSGNYSEPAGDQRASATLTVETTQPVTLLANAGPASDAELFCIASFTQAEWIQNAQASVTNGNGTVIPAYRTLHLVPAGLDVQGDRVGHDSSLAYAEAYTDDGHRGGVCWFELDRLRAISGGPN